MRVRRSVGRSVAWSVLWAVLLTSMVAAPAAAEDPAPEEPATVPGRIVVSWRATTGTAERGAVRGRHGLTTEDVSGDLELVSLPAHRVAAVTDALNADPAVVLAEPELILEVATTPNDTSFDSLWGLHNTGQSSGVADVDIDGPEAWALTRGSPDVVVAVIDTGVQIGHPDLAANIWVNVAERDGVANHDDDGNGYVDDVNGWDFKYDNASVYDSASEDDHGTHVAGTIAAVADNLLGVAGAAPNVRIMPLKFLGGTDGTGSSWDAAKAVDYAARNGARIINASWGGGGGDTLRNAIAAATGVAFVAAAGNAGVDTDASPFYPASWARDSHGMPNVLSVASITRTGARSSFSNYGAASVDVGAPGSSITSTWPASTYATISGTSMAAPHAAGVAALVAGLAPALTGAQLVEAVKAGVQSLTSMAGITTTGGLVNAYASILPYAVPGVPTGAAAVAGHATATVSWNAPSDGGTPASYAVSVTPAEGVTGELTRTVTAPATSLAFGGLTNGTAYTFTVTATNAGGTSVASAASASVTPAPTAPGAPSGLTATNGDGSVALSWAAPTDDGGSAVTSYDVTTSHLPEGAEAPVVETESVTAPTTSLLVDGLTNGVAYTFEVRAVNAQGAGAAVTAGPVSPRVLTAPGAPTAVTAVAGNAAVTVTWSPPADDGGRPVTSYTVTAEPGPATVTAGSTSATVTGLTNGTPYTFTVTASNEIGVGEASAPSVAVTPVAPPPPPPAPPSGGGGGGGSAPAPAPAPTSPPGSASGDVEPGGTVTTDPTGAGATPDAPAQTAVTSPVAGAVAIQTTDVVSAAPDTWEFLATEVIITAPVASAADPLTIEFRLDGSLDAADAVPFRNGVPVAECAGSAIAEPDPCVTARRQAGDDVVITVLTSRASRWNFGFATTACPAGRVEAAGFTDASGAHAASIACLAWWDVTDGLTATTFGASVPVRRDQMASFLARALREAGVDLPTGGDRFGDVSGGAHGAAIEALAAAGIVGGVAEGRYDPAGRVTRAQMATFLRGTVAYATGQPLAAGSSPFTDLGTSPHRAAIEAVHRAELVRGLTATTFGPGNVVTRAQMASFLVNLLDLLVERGLARPPIT